MQTVLNLGEIYISDFIKDESYYSQEGVKKYPLELYVEENGAVRLTEMAPKHLMWGKYWYRSGTNQSMTNELKGIAEQVASRVKLKDGDVWLDIACNDGTMFKFMPSNVIKVGIDPAEDSFLQESSKYAKVVQDYFSVDAFNKLGLEKEKKCKVITNIAMFYDIDKPNDFINDIKEILDDDGVWVVQMSYTPLMLEQLAFDNICHEHVYYYDLTSFVCLMNKNKMKVVDCELNDTNGGSFRVYIQKEKAKEDSYGTTPLRSVAKVRLESIFLYELENDITSKHAWEQFNNRIQDLKQKTYSFIANAKAEGKRVYAYGASTKGNTLLQLFGLDHTMIDAAVERSPYKIGLKTVGTNIPIITEEEMRVAPPDYMLVLPWHFINEFVQRERNFLKNGGKFIVPCPEFEIIGN